MDSIKLQKKLLIPLVLMSFSQPSQSHEFWIEPITPSANLETKVTAHLRVGQEFNGEAMYYLPRNLQKLMITDELGTRDVVRTIGDFPVFEQPVKSQGLQILSYQSRSNKVTYKTIEKFKSFLTAEGLDWVHDEHIKLGLPLVNFSETYVRYSKALVNRGKPSRNDQKVGFLFELVAQENPYSLNLKNHHGHLKVQLLWQNKPFTNGQVSIFEKSTAKAKITGEDGQQDVQNSTLTKQRTNANGMVTVPVKAGSTYLLNAVQITLGNSDTDVIWNSHWASLTFSIYPNKKIKN